MSSDFQNLVVWQMAIELADHIYDAAAQLPREELYLLTAQLKNSAASVPANIAEGKGRWSTLDYRRFARYARGSAYEVQSHLLLAGRRNFLDADLVERLVSETDRLLVKLNSLIRYLSRKTKKAPVTRHQSPVTVTT